ncbi:MAG: DNA polymerase III subunit alpha [Candidatus Limnocylindrus sp.]
MTDRSADVPFAELHAKSAFSFLRATATPEALVARAVELGLRGLALVDEGSLSGAVRFIRAAEAAQLPALLGVEFEMADPAVPDIDGIVLPLPRSRVADSDVAVLDGVARQPLPQRQRRPLNELVPHADRRGVADAELGPRLVALAVDERGYRSLARLLSRSNLEASKGVTRLRHALLEDHLREYPGSLILIAPFDESEIARRLAAGDRAGACAVVERLAAVALRGALHLEIVDRQLRGDAWLLDEMTALAARCSLPLVASAAPRSALPSERELLDALTGIRHGLPIHRLGPLRFPQAETHLRAGSELLAAHPSARAVWSAALDRTAAIAAEASIHLDFARVRFAGIDLPAGVSADEELARQVRAGVPRRYPEGGAELERRITGELAAIERTGLAEFFLLCAEIVRKAHADGIAAQGRGSAGDSVIAYLLGITRVDPIRHNLIFERFLNEGRESYPDVDVDFASDRRDEVIDTVLERFGPRHVALVCTFITYRSRSAARDVGLALGLPEALVDEGARKLEAHDPSVVGAQLATDPRWGALLRSNISASGETLWERWVRLCDEIDGLPRHRSMHPGGIVATAEPLDELAPVERSTDGTRAVLQFDKHDIESLKLVKLDLLGLGILTAITDALDLIARDVGVRPDLDALPEEIAEVWRAVGAADTIGVFQIESRAQQQSLPRTKPAKMDDLVAQVAIIRPGPIQGNAVHPYLRRRAGLERVTYPHQALAPILDETLGVILYQEQVMRIAIEVAGFTPGASDVFRRAMGSARSEREMELLRTRFVDGAIGTVGMRAADATELFERVAAFASFGFAKSHAAAFARTAFESAWLRLHYPAHYLAGLIRAQPMGFYPVEALIHDARRHGVTVQPVCINRSEARTSTEPIETRAEISSDPFIVVPTSEERAAAGSERALSYAVRLGLNLVRGVGTRTAEAIVAARARGGAYQSLEDFARRTQLPLSALERLIRAGALDAFGGERRALLWQAAEVGAAIALPPRDAPAHLTPVDRLEALIDAHGLVGADPAMQPIELWREALTRTGTATVASLRHCAAGPARIAGLLLSRQQPPTAHGTVFLALEDETGIANVTIRARDWPRLRGAVRSASLLLVEGELQRTGEVANLVATRIAPLTRAEMPRQVRTGYR